MRGSKDISSRSPKNKYFAEVYYNEALKNIGSVSSLGGMDIDDLKNSIPYYLGDNIKKAKGATVVIRKNRKTFPEFDWQVVETYHCDL